MIQQIPTRPPANSPMASAITYGHQFGHMTMPRDRLAVTVDNAQPLKQGWTPQTGRAR